MSCDACSQDPLRGVFYRWKHANVEIVGCREHLREILAALNDVQRASAVRTGLAEQLAEELIDHVKGDLSAWGTSLADAQRSHLVGTCRQKILEALETAWGAVRKPPAEGAG